MQLSRFGPSLEAFSDELLHYRLIHDWLALASGCIDPNQSDSSLIQDHAFYWIKLISGN
jgi:hypothetical protein